MQQEKWRGTGILPAQNGLVAGGALAVAPIQAATAAKSSNKTPRPMRDR
jgi:hypothetical protein